jgi:FkbM family methyltransferase
MRNKTLEKLSWKPFYFFVSKMKMLSNPMTVNLKKIDIPKQINFHYSNLDEGLSRQFGLFGFREPLNWKNYYYYVDKDDIVLDVGANMGLFSLLAQNAKAIIAVEPIRECIPILKKNLDSNGLSKKSTILNMAVGKKGKLFMKQEGHINLSKVVDKKKDATYEVPSEILSYFVTKYNANLLRMDVEGYEYEILKGNIPVAINKISLEFHTGIMGKRKSIKLLKHLEKEGFKVDKLIEDLPLRLYPFYSFLKKLNLLRKITYVKRNKSIRECVPLILKGRSIKYLFLRRRK